SSVSSTIQKQFTIPVKIQLVTKEKDKKITKILSLTALVDSGAQKTFLDSEFVKKYRIATSLIQNPFNINLADGSSGRKPVSSIAKITLQIGDKHKEELVCNVTNIPNHQLILGLDWLKQHQPILDFSKLSIDFKSLFCNKNCLVQ